MARMVRLENPADPTAAKAYSDAQKAISDYAGSHGKKLNETERKEFGELLKNRARAISDLLGVEVGSIAD